MATFVDHRFSHDNGMNEPVGGMVPMASKKVLARKKKHNGADKIARKRDSFAIKEITIPSPQSTSEDCNENRERSPIGQESGSMYKENFVSKRKRDKKKKRMSLALPAIPPLPSSRRALKPRLPLSNTSRNTRTPVERTVTRDRNEFQGNREDTLQNADYRHSVTPLNDDLLDWRTEVSPLEGPRSVQPHRRTDSKYLLLPVPSLRDSPSPIDAHNGTEETHQPQSSQTPVIEQDEVLDWRISSNDDEDSIILESSLTNRRRRRLDSRDLLLAIPSPPHGEHASLTLPAPEKQLQKRPENEEEAKANKEDMKPSDDQDVFDWRNEISPPPTQVSINHTKRRTDVKSLLLPIPSLREENSPLVNGTQESNSAPSPTSCKMESETSALRLEMQELQQELDNYRQSNLVVTSQRDRLQHELDRLDLTGSQHRSPGVDMASQCCLGADTTQHTSELQNRLDEALKMLEELQASHFVVEKDVYHPPVKVELKTLLPVVTEEEMLPYANIIAQRDAALLEKETLQRQLDNTRKDYETRVTPFRDLFEDKRKERLARVRLQAENARLANENEDFAKSVSMLQKQMVESVQIALSKVEAGKAEKIRLETRVQELESQLAEATLTISTLRVRVSELGEFP